MKSPYIEVRDTTRTISVTCKPMILLSSFFPRDSPQMPRGSPSRCLARVPNASRKSRSGWFPRDSPDSREAFRPQIKSEPGLSRGTQTWTWTQEGLSRGIWRGLSRGIQTSPGLWRDSRGAFGGDYRGAFRPHQDSGGTLAGHLDGTIAGHSDLTRRK